MATNSKRIPIRFIVYVTIDAIPREPFETAEQCRNFEQLQTQVRHVASKFKGSLLGALTTHYKEKRDITPWLERLGRKD